MLISVCLVTVLCQLLRSNAQWISDFDVPNFRLRNPCPSEEKDKLLGIDRKTDDPNKILLLGYITGAAASKVNSAVNIDYRRSGSMISGTLSYTINLINTLRERYNSSERTRLHLPEPPLPSGFKLDFCYVETHGDTSASIRAVTTLIEHVQLSAIIGPQESCSVEAAIASTYNMPMLSHYCDDARIREKSFGRRQPVFLRTKPQPYDIAAAVLTLLEHFHWDKVAYITTQDKAYAFTTEVIRNTMTKHGIEILYTMSFPHPQLYGLLTNYFRTIVEESYRKVRIYIVIGEGHDSFSLLETLREADLLKSGDYFVIGIDKRTYDPVAVHVSDEMNLKGSCLHTDPNCRKAYMLLTHTPPMTEQCSALQEYNLCYLKKAPFNVNLSSDYFVLQPEAGYLMDAVWLYAVAAGEILNAGGSLTDTSRGNLIAERLINRRYISSLGYANEINERGDAQGNYTVVMGVPEELDIPDDMRGCTLLCDANRTATWYEHHTPMLPRDCRKSNSATKHIDLCHHFSSATTSKQSRIKFRPVGMFYTTAEVESEGQVPTEKTMTRKQEHTFWNKELWIQQNIERNGTQNITYDFSETIPLLPQLSERIKRYTFHTLPGQQIHWISGKPPASEPPCGFDNRKCRRKRRWILRVTLSILCTVATSLVIGLFLLYRSRKFERELESLLWKVDYRDIVLTDSSEQVRIVPSTENFWVNVQKPIDGTFTEREAQIGSLDKLFRQAADNAANMTMFTSNAQRREARKLLTLQSHVSRDYSFGTNLLPLTNGGINDTQTNRQGSVTFRQLGSEISHDESSPVSGELQEQCITSKDNLISLTSHRNNYSYLLKHRHIPLLPKVHAPEEKVSGIINGVNSWVIPSTVRGVYKKKPVAVHRLNIHCANLNREVKRSLKLLRDLSHNNVCQFIGACVQPDRVCVLWDYASRGSLRDIFQPARPRLKPIFVVSLSLDLIRGLTFLHDSDLRYHGNLKSTNCLIDSRWMLKLTDFGLTEFRMGESFAHLDNNAYCSRLLWTPPELLRRMLALLISGQLCQLSHPQLIPLAEQLMRQGITFSISHYREECGNVSKGNRIGDHDQNTDVLTAGTQRSFSCNVGRAHHTVSDFTQKHQSNDSDSQKDVEQSMAFSGSWRYDSSQKSVRQPRRRQLSHPGYRSLSALKSLIDNDEHSRFSQVVQGRRYSERSEHCSHWLYAMDDGQREPEKLVGNVNEQQQPTSPRNTIFIPAVPAVIERTPKLSTIMIHPEGASFVEHSANHCQKHGDLCQFGSTKSHSNFHIRFQRSEKVHHGGLFSLAKAPGRRKRFLHKSGFKFVCLRKLRGSQLSRKENCSPLYWKDWEQRFQILSITPHTSVSPCSKSELECLMSTQFPSQKRDAVHLPEVRDPIGSMQMADIYALGMVLFELHYQNDPYNQTRHKPQEIIRRVVVLNDEFKIPYRPNLSHLSREEKYLTDCIEACWAENPLDRPTIKEVAARLRPMKNDRQANIMDNMMSLMEDYAVELEKLVEARSAELMEEKRRTEQLLYQMLPEPVAEQLKRGKMVEPEAFDNVTIYFSDICGFTEWSSTASAFEVVNLLNELYTRFDAVLSSYDVYKVETVGDAYMVVSGLPKRNEDHAGEIASMSLRLLDDIKQNFTLSLRIGIHSGPCAAGVVGTKMPRYCLFGDTVNTASRMESHGAPCRIHCSEQCKYELDRLGVYYLEERGLISIKGKGIVRTYWLLHKTKPSITTRKIPSHYIPAYDRRTWTFGTEGKVQLFDPLTTVNSGIPVVHTSESDSASSNTCASEGQMRSNEPTHHNQLRLSRPSWFARAVNASTRCYFGSERKETLFNWGHNSLKQKSANIIRQNRGHGNPDYKENQSAVPNAKDKMHNTMFANTLSEDRSKLLGVIDPGVWAIRCTPPSPNSPSETRPYSTSQNDS